LFLSPLILHLFAANFFNVVKLFIFISNRHGDNLLLVFMVTSISPNQLFCMFLLSFSNLLFYLLVPKLIYNVGHINPIIIDISLKYP
jgi:hypothetical protein